MTNSKRPDLPAGAASVTLSRRRLVGAGAISAAALAVGGLGWRLFGAAAPQADLRVLTPSEYAMISVASAALFPPGNALGLGGPEAGVPRYLDNYLAAMSTESRTLTRSMFWLLDQGTFAAGYLRPLRKLTPAAAKSYLDSWGASSIAFRRAVSTSFRTVLAMAYTAHPKVRRQIGIRSVCQQTGPSFLPRPVA